MDKLREPIDCDAPVLSLVWGPLRAGRGLPSSANQVGRVWLEIKQAAAGLSLAAARAPPHGADQLFGRQRAGRR